MLNLSALRGAFQIPRAGWLQNCCNNLIGESSLNLSKTSTVQKVSIAIEVLHFIPALIPCKILMVALFFSLMKRTKNQGLRKKKLKISLSG
jgi:hypothetical protein